MAGGTFRRARATIWSHAWWLVIGTLATVEIVARLRTGWDATYSPINGTFQNYHPITRMARGEAPYRDFVSYLGNGPTLVLAAMGPVPTLVDVIVRAKIACFAAFVAMLAGMLLCLRGGRLVFSSFLGLLAMASQHTPWVAQLHLQRAATELLELSAPGNSMLPLRAVLPFCQGMLLVNFLPAYLSPRRLHRLCYLVLMGLVGGAGVGWTNDFGIASLLALLGVHTVVFLRSSRLRTAGLQGLGAELVMQLLAAAIGCFAFTLLCTKGNFRAWYVYNFRGVLSSQFWYFEGPHPFTWEEIPRDAFLVGGTLVYLGLFASSLLRRTEPDRQGIALLFAHTAAALAALASVLGGHWDSHYFSAFLFVSFFASIHLLERCWTSLRARHGTFIASRPAHGALFARAGRAFSLLCGLYFLATAGGRFRDVRREQRPPPDWTYVEKFGGFVGPHMRTTLTWGAQLEQELGDLPANRRIFSTYATGLDLLSGAVQPSRSDYIIHALGVEERARYLEAFRAASTPYVTTFRDDWTGFEGWIRGANWWWYKEMLRSYRPFGSDVSHVLWKRSEGGLYAPNSTYACKIEPLDPYTTELEIRWLGPLTQGASHAAAAVANRPRLVNVAVGYAVAGPGGLVSAIDRRRELVRVDAMPPPADNVQLGRTKGRSTFNVDPKASSVDVPAVVVRERPTRVFLNKHPRRTAGLMVTTCTVQDICDAEQVFAVP